IPPTCTSLAGAEGRCLSVCIPKVAAQVDILPQASCGATERCVPCTNPLDGQSTGACTLSCDPGPTQAPVTLPACCEDQGQCIPTGAIPEDMQSHLEDHGCQGDSLCVPTANLPGAPAPMKCSASGLILIGDYTGVCLSECLRLGVQGLLLGTGNC